MARQDRSPGAPRHRHSRLPAEPTANPGTPDRPRSNRRATTMNADERNPADKVGGDEDFHISALQVRSMPELIAIAQETGFDAVSGLSKPELIFEILKIKASEQGHGWGHGTLDILPDGFGFLRSRRYNYHAGPDDIYVSPSQIRRLNLKQGHQLTGPVRPPKVGEKYFALLHIEAVNGQMVEALDTRIPFDNLTPLLPNQRFILESEGCDPALRLVDLLAPIGRGQRALILSPPHSGRSNLLIQLADAILRNDPEVYVILLMIDERPEEVTEAVRRTGPDDRREVIASTFDEPTAHQVAVAEMVGQKARRMVESGRHVVLLMDSVTALVRAYNTEIPHSGKVICAGLDAASLFEPKRLFGAARRVEEGGSLTIIATALTDTGSRTDDTIAEEFKGKGNCEIVLDQHLAGMHVYPAIDIERTGTRREDSLLPQDELEKLRRLRKELGQHTPQVALERLMEKLAETANNAELIDKL